MHRLIVIFVIVIVILAAATNILFCDADDSAALSLDAAARFVESQLDRVFKTLKQDEIEERLSKVVQSKAPKDSDDAVDEMAKKLSKKFAKSRQVVLDLKRVFEDTWNGSSAASSTPLNARECCEIKPEEYYKEFKAFVDPKKLCVNRVLQRSGNPMEPLTVDEKVLKTMRDNWKNDPSLKWQHFGTQNGFSAVYPEVQMNPADNCHDFDPRERPW